MKLGSSRGMDAKRPRGSERSKPCHQLRLTRRSLPPYPWPPEQAPAGCLQNPCRTTRSMNNVALWWVEEARNISQKVLSVLLPTMRAPGCEVIWTYNPHERDDPVDLYFRRPRSSRQRLCAGGQLPRQSLFRQPHLASRRVEDLKRRNHQAYLHTWCGKYDERTNSRVFDPARYRFGYPDGEPLRIPTLYGCDHGFSQDPFGLLKLVPYPKNVLYIAAEKLTHGAVIDALPGIVLAFLHNPGAVVMADNARPELNDYLRRNGCPNVISVSKPRGSIEDGFRSPAGFHLDHRPSLRAILSRGAFLCLADQPPDRRQDQGRTAGRWLWPASPGLRQVCDHQPFPDADRAR